MSPIRDTLAPTKSATFAVHLPGKAPADFPKPMGTGFFVSPDGWFLTAAHVVTADGRANGPIRKDVDKLTLMKEARFVNEELERPETCTEVRFDGVDPIADVAYLKIDAEKVRDAEWLEPDGLFPYISVSSRLLDEGEPVYAFGYPLSRGDLLYPGPAMAVGSITLTPRVTSAIVASLIDEAGMVIDSGPPLRYVLDKALNYGNSGGPIVATETGRAHALCSSFQPVFIPQAHLATDPTKAPSVMIPSLYGKVLNLSHPRVLEALRERSIPLP